MTEMSSDEDVVFEGSALHQHLQEIGMSVETSQRSVLRTFGTHDTTNKNSKKRHTYLQSYLNCILQGIVSPWTQLFKVNLDVKPYVDTVINSCLLEEDSMLTLINSVETMPVHPTAQKYHSATEWAKFWSSAFGSLVALPACCVVLVGALVTTMEIRKHEQHLTQLRTLVKHLKAFRHDASSGLSLINDHELIQRGFMMSNSSAPGWRLASNQSYRKDMLPELRETLTSTLFAAVHSLAGVSIELSSVQPLLPIYDPCDIVVDEVDDIIAEKSAERGSLVQLKFLFTAFTMSQSRMLHRLALSVCPQAALHPQTKVPDEVLKQPSILKEVLVPLQQSVNRDLTYSRRLDILLLNKKREPFKPPTKLVDVHTAIHSAALHTQSLFASLSAAEDKLQEACTGSDSDLPDIKTVKQLLELVEVCKKHNEKNESCLDVAELRLVKLMESRSAVVPKLKMCDEQDDSNETSLDLVEVGRSDYSFQGDSVDVFEEERSEGEASSSEDEELQMDLHDIVRSRRENMEVSRRLQRELQAVLEKKAQAYGIREAKALSTITERSEKSTRSCHTPRSTTLSRDTDMTNKVSAGGDKNVTLHHLSATGTGDGDDGDNQLALPKLASLSHDPNNGPVSKEAVVKVSYMAGVLGTPEGTPAASDVINCIKSAIESRAANVEEVFGDD